VAGKKDEIQFFPILYLFWVASFARHFQPSSKSAASSRRWCTAAGHWFNTGSVCCCM